MQALASKLVSRKPTFEEGPQMRRAVGFNQELDWKRESGSRLQLSEIHCVQRRGKRSFGGSVNSRRRR